MASAGRWKKRLGCVTVPLVLLVVGIVLAAHFYQEPSEKLDKVSPPFDAHFAEYLDADYSTVAGLTTTEVTAYPQVADISLGELDGYTRGKLVVVDTTTRKMDSIFLALPVELAATSHEEVGTIVLVRYTTLQVSTYEGGAKGLQIRCDVRVADFKDKKIVGLGTFWGEFPPYSYLNTGKNEDQTGRAPTKEVAAYLQALPRK